MEKLIKHTDIEGWFDKQLEKFYSSMVDRFQEGHFVEVGCFKGRSTCFLAQKIQKSEKNIQLTVVDNFIGENKEENLLVEFSENMKRAGVRGVVDLIASNSVDAAKMFNRAMFDFVFIDACHEYDAVKEDILAWLPKVRKGGILAGDDYSSKHLGVQEAVKEILGDKAKVQGRIWFCEV